MKLRASISISVLIDQGDGAKLLNTTLRDIAAGDVGTDLDFSITYENEESDQLDPATLPFLLMNTHEATEANATSAVSDIEWCERADFCHSHDHKPGCPRDVKSPDAESCGKDVYTPVSAVSGDQVKWQVDDCMGFVGHDGDCVSDSNRRSRRRCGCGVQVHGAYAGDCVRISNHLSYGAAGKDCLTSSMAAGARFREERRDANNS